MAAPVRFVKTPAEIAAAKNSSQTRVIPKLKDLDKLSEKLDQEKQIVPVIETKVEAGISIHGLVEWLTWHEHPNPEFAHTFLLTYHTYIPPQELLRMLIKRACIHPPKIMMMGSSQTGLSARTKPAGVFGFQRKGDNLHPGNKPDAGTGNKARMFQILEFEKGRQIPIRLRVCGILRMMINHHFEDFLMNTKEKEEYAERVKRQREEDKKKKNVKQTRAIITITEEDETEEPPPPPPDDDEEAATDTEEAVVTVDISGKIINPVMAETLREYCLDILPSLGMHGQGDDLWTAFGAQIKAQGAKCEAYEQWSKINNIMLVMSGNAPAPSRGATKPSEDILVGHWVREDDEQPKKSKDKTPKKLENESFDKSSKTKVIKDKNSKGSIDVGSLAKTFGEMAEIVCRNWVHFS